MKSLRVYPEKCTGCAQCVLMCSFTKKAAFSPRDALLRLLPWEEYCLTVPVVCDQCEDAPCESACPESAISRHPLTEAVVVDPQLCSACGLCCEACPTGSIQIERDSDVAAKCDLCGGQPACVPACYPEALRFEDMDWDHRQAQQSRSVEALAAYSKRETPGFRITVSE
jgi:carbon-monoxide dehydrogenase iron sulfur subunit